MTRCRGRSGLHRAGRWATPTRSNPRDSATENKPPRSPDRGKGETVVQETTSGPGDRTGSANPARSKVEQRTSEGCPPECAGGPHEVAGNGGPRWMAAERDAARRPGTEPGLQTNPSATDLGTFSDRGAPRHRPVPPGRVSGSCPREESAAGGPSRPSSVTRMSKFLLRKTRSGGAHPYGRRRGVGSVRNWGVTTEPATCSALLRP